MPDNTEGIWMKRIKFGAWAISGIATVVFSLWAAANSHFAIADEVVARDVQIEAKVEENKEQIKAQKMTTEESMVEMQIDIVEDRIERAEKKTGAARDQSKIDKLKRRLARIEMRSAVLEAIRIQKETDDGE